MKKATKKFWIKERRNPQLGTYYTLCGQLSNTAALKHEKAIYGSNIMRSFDTEEAYQKKIEELRKAGESVHT